MIHAIIETQEIDLHHILLHLFAKFSSKWDEIHSQTASVY